jgi:hypothetical protein
MLICLQFGQSKDAQTALTRGEMYLTNVSLHISLLSSTNENLSLSVKPFTLTRCRQPNSICVITMRSLGQERNVTFSILR